MPVFRFGATSCCSFITNRAIKRLDQIDRHLSLIGVEYNCPNCIFHGSLMCRCGKPWVRTDRLKCRSLDPVGLDHHTIAGFAAARCRAASILGSNDPA